MKRPVSLLLALTALVLWATPNPAALAADKVLAIGDSWGYAIPEPLNTHFDTHGHADWDVLNLAVPGGTADAYANDAAGVLTATQTILAATPSIEVVLISLGGNDLWPNYLSQGAAIFTAIENDLRVVVNAILGVRPDVDIVFTGYDILKFDKSNECLLFAYNFFGVVLPWEVSPLFIEIGNRQAAIDADYPEVTYLNLFGTGQGNPGSPNILEWSPSAYVADDNLDCLHLSSSGYTKFTLEIYCQTFAPRFGQSCTAGPWGAASVAGTGEPSGDLSVRGGLALLLTVPLAAVLLWRRRVAHRTRR